jgi:hypothetical protein
LETILLEIKVQTLFFLLLHLLAGVVVEDIPQMKVDTTVVLAEEAARVLILITAQEAVAVQDKWGEIQIYLL